MNTVVLILSLGIIAGASFAGHNLRKIFTFFKDQNDVQLSNARILTNMLKSQKSESVTASHARENSEDEALEEMEEELDEEIGKELEEEIYQDIEQIPLIDLIRNKDEKDEEQAA
jgi:hypothetical protein